MTSLASCEEIDKKICHLQENGSVSGSMSQGRLFVMTEHAVMKFPRLRSYKSVPHFHPHLRGVEFIGLPAHISDESFQEKLDAIAASIKRCIEELRAAKALERPGWEPPVYHFLRCQRDAGGSKCKSTFSCDGILGPTKG